ncbi:MAG: RDD family protein [Agarilytica sp.]
MQSLFNQYQTDFHALITETRRTIETPEGAELPLVPAGVGARISAFVIDFFIKLGISIAFSVVLGFFGRAGMGIFLIFYFLIEWFYPVVFEVWWHGQTPGKMRLKLAVVNDDGTPVTFAASLIRNLLRVVDFMPFAYIAALCSSVINSQFKRIGDLAAGTVVVHVYEKRSIPAINVEGVRPVPNDFTTEEQRVLLDFAERASQLSVQRQEELASILSPVIGSKNPVKAIKQMAGGLVGER